jgi:hypothetical protein
MSPPAIDRQFAQAIEDYDVLRKIIPKFGSSHAWLGDADDLSGRISPRRRMSRLSDVEAEFDQWIANIQARHAAAGPGASHAGP